MMPLEGEKDVRIAVFYKYGTQFSFPAVQTPAESAVLALDQL